MPQLCTYPQLFIHYSQIEALTKAHEEKIHQIRQESDLAANQQQAELRNQHSANMEGLRNEHRRMEAKRNAEIEKLRREQASLNQQFANANQKLQELRNRPGNYIKASPHTVYNSTRQLVFEIWLYYTTQCGCRLLKHEVRTGQ